jgi:hypothetical protein
MGGLSAALSKMDPRSSALMIIAGRRTAVDQGRLDEYKAVVGNNAAPSSKPGR